MRWRTTTTCRTSTPTSTSPSPCSRRWRHDMSVTIGDAAPEFTLPGTGEASYSLKDYAGHKVVLVFYPGDDTPVCTKQLNAYNDDLAQFTDLGAHVLAISAQDVTSHERFSSKH